VGLLFVDPRLRIEYANQKTAQILGAPSADALIGTRLPQCAPIVQSVVGSRIRQCLETEAPQREQLVLETGGRPVCFTVYTDPLKNGRDQTVGVRLLFEERDGRKGTELHLHPPPHLESMSLLADGIARDFSDILWEVLGNAELATAEIEVGHPARYNLEQVESACRRAQELVMRLVRFSRHSEQKRKPVRLSAIVVESLQQLSAEIPKKIRIEHHLSTDEDLILAEPSEILQLLSHLYRNALQAMDGDSGTLEVSIVDVVLEADELSEHPGLMPGRHLLLTVMDTGPGMDADLLTKIFDPFFSTQSPKHHSGLGLAIVKSIARAHGGTVSIDSRPGKGTMVHLIFPALHSRRPADAAHPAALSAGIGTILLVDGDPSVREMRGRMIRRMGYEVQAVGSSREALQRFEQSPERYDLILTDHSLPDHPAIQMVEKMKQIRSQVPILLCTGFSGPEVEADAGAAGVDRLLIKPLRMKELARTLREILPPSPPR